MTIQRMDHVGVVVDDVRVDIAFVRTRTATAGLS
jgi:hypothetical protein